MCYVFTEFFILFFSRLFWFWKYDFNDLFDINTNLITFQRIFNRQLFRTLSSIFATVYWEVCIIVLSNFTKLLSIKKLDYFIYVHLISFLIGNFTRNFKWSVTLGGILKWRQVFFKDFGPPSPPCQIKSDFADPP